MKPKKKFTPKEAVVRTPFVPTYPPSEEQEAIFKVVENDDENIHIEASPGSGKTTTLVWAMTKETLRTNAAMLAFSKAIVTEIEPRCRYNVKVATAHSFGYQALSAALGRLNLFNGKTQHLFKELYPHLDPTKKSGKQKGEAYSFMFDLVKLIDMLRVNLADENNINEVVRIADQYNIELDLNDAVPMLKPMFVKMLENPRFIDFTDMMWIPIRMDLPVPKFDMMYVDERQDLNSLMIEYVSRMSQGRIVTCGDSCQSIFSFAGADIHSTERLVKAFPGIELPLNVCYRCGTNIVDLARTIYDKIKPFEKSPPGEVIRGSKLDMEMPDGSMILSRRNANLVKPCFEFLRAGRKAIIKGKDIGEGLVRMIESVDATDALDLALKIEDLRDKKLMKLMDKEGKQSQMEKITDECQCVIEICGSCQSVAEVKDGIEMIFDEKVQGITLSSIHRSKGLESNEVAIIDYSRIRLNHEKMSEEDHIQEKNLHFVAVTRAKNKLTLID